MPRQPRLDAPGALHHVIGRGINGVKIFDSRKDQEDFIERLAGLCGADALNVYSWAFLSNHFHLLVRTGNQPLSNSGADVARFLGINTSAVNRLAVSDELPGVEKYI